MFISVSSNLPTTSYVKMIDIWLLGSLILPFVEVLLHTYIDFLRHDYDREINHHHHGETRRVGDESNDRVGSGKYQSSQCSSLDNILLQGGLNLVSRNEQTEVLAKQAWYDRVRVSNEQWLQLCKRISKYHVPLIFLVFFTSWTFIGLSNYYFPN